MLGPSRLLQWQVQMDAHPRGAEALDRLARDGLVRAVSDGRVAAWIEGHAGPLWGALGLYADRAFRRRDGYWEPQGTGTGTWCLMMPLLEQFRPRPTPFLSAATGLQLIARWHVVDLVAIDPDGEQIVSSLTGNFDGVLGRWEMALSGEMPLRVFRSPLAWLQHALDVEADAELPEPICLAWPHSPAARDVLLYAGALICDDDAHAAAIDRAIRKVRKAALPPAPRLKVARKPAAAAQAA